jgi:hypothetical protein
MTADSVSPTTERLHRLTVDVRVLLGPGRFGRTRRLPWRRWSWPRPCGQEIVDKPEIERIHRDNYGAYGARKMWLALNREGITVARCTVAG